MPLCSKGIQASGGTIMLERVVLFGQYAGGAHVLEVTEVQKFPQSEIKKPERPSSLLLFLGDLSSRLQRRPEKIPRNSLPCVVSLCSWPAAFLWLWLEAADPPHETIARPISAATNRTVKEAFVPQARNLGRKRFIPFS